MSEQYFKDPTSFKPERWLDPNARELETRLVTFSRGSRGCLGIKSVYSSSFLPRFLDYISPNFPKNIDKKPMVVHLFQKEVQVRLTALLLSISPIFLSNSMNHHKEDP